MSVALGGAPAGAIGSAAAGITSPRTMNMPNQAMMAKMMGVCVCVCVCVCACVCSTLLGV